MRATVLYDQPPTFFRRTSLSHQHDLFQRVGLNNHPYIQQCPTCRVEGAHDSLLTSQAKNGKVTERVGAPLLVMSATSWTPDEDFGILLKALQEWERREEGRGGRQHLVVVITGKGPMREEYEREVEQLQLRHVHILTAWVAAEDYPLLLGSAQLGVSLHTSSSGIDLPMKVVDMFGCRLPVCAIDFLALPELVQHNVNGLVFKTPLELASQLGQLFGNGEKGRKELERLREGINTRSWDEEWREKAWPVVRRARDSSPLQGWKIVAFALATVMVMFMVVAWLYL